MAHNDHLEVILKLTEVCNIACKYCYYFFSGDDRPGNRPANLSETVTHKLVEFLNEGFLEGAYKTIQIDFHGGEPMMLGHSKFKRIVAILSEGLEVQPRLAITTNAMFITDNWIDTFSSHSVNVCVSVDGPQAIHDRQRIDKRGAGTYKRVHQGIKVLQDAVQKKKISEISALCVVQSNVDGAEVYRHIVHDLGIKHLDFLLPDNTHDTFDISNAISIKNFMKGAFSEWLSDDDPKIQVRLFDSVLQLLVGGQSRLGGFGARAGTPTAITIGSDGSVDGDDFLKPTGVENIATGLSILSSPFAEIIERINHKEIGRELSALPDGCLGCTFNACCGGGQATHRYSKTQRFNNPSIHCDTQKMLFSLAASHLISSGIDPVDIAHNAMK